MQCAPPRPTARWACNCKRCAGGVSASGKAARRAAKGPARRGRRQRERRQGQARAPRPVGQRNRRVGERRRRGRRHGHGGRWRGRAPLPSAEARPSLGEPAVESHADTDRGGTPDDSLCSLASNKNRRWLGWHRRQTSCGCGIQVLENVLLRAGIRSRLLGSACAKRAQYSHPAAYNGTARV